MKCLMCENKTKTKFCSKKCANVYKIIKNSEFFKKFGYPLEKVDIEDCYDLNVPFKTLESLGFNECSQKIKEFKKTHKRCKFCNQLYAVSSKREQMGCPNEECKKKLKNMQSARGRASYEKYYNSTDNPKTFNNPAFWNEINTKRLKSLEKYGGSPLKDPKIQEKAKKTKLTRYGDKHFNNLEKQRHTKLTRYGNEYFNNPEKMKETWTKKSLEEKLISVGKCKETKLINHGDSNFNNKEKISHTWNRKTKEQKKQIQNKRTSSNLEKYGVRDSNFVHLKNPENYDNREYWISNFTFTKNNQIYIDFDKICETFGILSQSTIYNKLKKLNIQGKTKQTANKLETKFLDTLNIPNLQRQHKIKNFKVDGYDPETNTIYEFLGDYWHGNLRYFNPNEVNVNNEETFLNLNTETFKRFNELIQDGYNIKYIWESDFLRYGLKALRDYKDYVKLVNDFLDSNDIKYELKENTWTLKDSNVILKLHRMEANPEFKNHKIHNETLELSKNNIRVVHLFGCHLENPHKLKVLKNVILHACGLTKNKLFARKLEIKVFPAIQTKSFFDENNINGYRNAKYSICLMHNGEIIMAYSLGHAYFGKGKYDAEIARGACKLGYSVIGGASKIWNYIIKNFDYNSIVYYVDLNYYNGQSMNFLDNCELVTNSPGFWNYWVQTGELKNREPQRHQVIMEHVRNGDIIEIQNAGTQVNVWTRN